MINSFDIETFEHEKKLVPYCVSSIVEKKEMIFFGLDCIDNFIDYLEEISLKKKKQKQKKIYLFSHNLTFDGSIILQHIKKKDLKIKGLFFKGNIYFLDLKFSEISITFKCSYRFFPSKLENGNKILNTSKKIDFNHSIINMKNFNNHKEKISEYCLNDSKIVVEIMILYNIIFSKFISNWIEISHSLPGISIKIFEKIFNFKKINIHSKTDEDFLFRSGYYGGRCEVFGNPEKDDFIYHFDFTGMYAQIMLEDFNFGEYEIILSPKNIYKNGFYFIEGFDSNNKIPILPHHSIKESKLLFTNGYIKGLYWWEEIELFLKKGGIVFNIKYWLKFKENGKIFSKFVKDFSEMRKIDKSHNAICKYIINSIYGRLGMGEINTETKLFNKEEYELFCKKNEKKIIKENWVNGLVFVEYKKKKTNENISSNVMLAATITSKARIKLYNGFLSVIENGGRLLYCDTDSIFAAFKGKVDNCRFGDVFFDTLKKDTKIKKAAFALPKAYSIVYENNDKVTKIKGFNKLDINYEEFYKMMTSDDKLSLRVDVLKKANFIITPETIEKTVYLGGYTKRIFSKDFIDTKPIYLKKNEEYTEERIEIDINEDDNFYKTCNRLNLKEKTLEGIKYEIGNIERRLENGKIKKETFIKIEIINIDEYWLSSTLLIERLLLNGLYNEEFKICNKSIILSKIMEKKSLFIELIFWGEKAENFMIN